MCDGLVNVGVDRGRTKDGRGGAEAWKRAHAELVRLAVEALVRRALTELSRSIAA